PSTASPDRVTDLAPTLANHFAAGGRAPTHTGPACDWQGTSRERSMDLHEGEAEGECPQCENPILLVGHPRLAQVQAA
ncbi:hypothetical protein, partial [Stenotrophomonas sp. SrG]|uniref:hypothetical protein n=1 Tax=Stenotrophomonas sp. SrG TaxID=3414430 RepID=UPI003CECDC4F